MGIKLFLSETLLSSRTIKRVPYHLLVYINYCHLVPSLILI